MRFFFNLLLGILISLPVLSQKRHQTGTWVPEIKTLQIFANDIFEMPPAIELDTEQFLTIGFDELCDEMNWISYRIVHCDAEWRPSSISELDYLDGFNGNPLENGQPSFNTFTGYYHYSLTLPNEKVNFRLSGNYAVLFYRDDRPEEIIATACFYVFERKTDVRAFATSNTDIDFNKEHQQVGITVKWDKYPISNPATDLKVKVTQNNRADTEATTHFPSRVGAKEVSYEHNRELIFEAGNNYRRFEIVSNRYPGVGVEKIRYFAPLYHAMLQPTPVKAKQNYYYDQDQNGRFIIRQSEANDHDTEADYYMVHFVLEYDNPLIEGQIHLSGEFTHNRFDENSKMIYNFDTKQYEKTLLLKQGHYNYQYLMLPYGKNQGTTGPIEGNFYETGNEYFIRVYHRPPGRRYDTLIGTALLK